MEEKQINISTNEELRSAIIMLDAKVKSMCNTKTNEEVNSLFMEAKDILIALYRYNFSRTKDEN